MDNGKSWDMIARCEKVAGVKRFMKHSLGYSS